ncbi:MULTISPECIES: arylsulfatase [Olivibacter]|uniref:Arylsulfatase n=1 Tax=Olivibacter jilunii TaxID=985016 RepID=A0ABW6B1H4_9SPHI|nr:arylsulfatase [Olivibacter sp. 47]MCL4637597.1 arylsulfatase [Olivibacter sp. UJ_SKK_5.1]MDM8173814.1 arylsulfatase [Olivibacter sp. 47]MDX3914997.1 arylsulfatase [Pseudosphingobacterium sp.]
MKSNRLMRWLAIVGQVIIFVLPLMGYAQNNTLPPNIIYIYADDLGYGDISPYGQKRIKTPYLDQMAKEGMQFTNHYTSTPVCAPARCMLLTGKHGGHSYIRGNYEMGGFPDSLEGGQMPLPEGTYTLAKMLKKAGYATGLIGKWGLGMHNTTGSPLKQGFDYYFGYLDQKQAHNYYPSHLWENDQYVKLGNPDIFVHRSVDSLKADDTDFDYFKGNSYAPGLMTDKALRFIERSKERRFFLYLPYTIPHVSLQAPDEYVNQYKDRFNDQPYYGQHGYAATKYPRATYAALISYLDAQVGLILQKLKELGLDERTIVMFSSDNGTAFNGGVDYTFFDSTAGLRGLKMDVFEGGIKEPFLVRWPGKIKPNSKTDHVSAQYDLMATIADLIGEDAGNTDGISFLPTLLGKEKKQKQHKFLYFEYPEKGGQLAIRKGDWKAIKLNMKGNRKAKWMLFNLGEDPRETNDLAQQHAELLHEFDRIVAREHQPAHILDWEIVDNKLQNEKR